MKISIITVCYNSAATIEFAINSVLSQTYPAIEYIIIDGGSCDDTIDIIKSFGKSIATVVSEPDNGIYDAMNKGIRSATGDVIGILNSDDLYADNNVINDVMKCFLNDPDLDILYGDLVYVKKKDLTKVVRKWKSKTYYKNFFEDANVPPHPALFLRSCVYQKEGLFDLKYKLAADYEFMLRIFKKHNLKSKYLNRLIVRMRLGGATNKNFKNIFNGNKEILKAWENSGLKVPITLIPLRIIKRLTQFL